MFRMERFGSTWFLTVNANLLDMSAAVNTWSTKFKFIFISEAESQKTEPLKLDKR